MGKLKQLSLDFKGYEIKGEAVISMWGGGFGNIEMGPCFISEKELTHNRLKQCVNDNGFGCEHIAEAYVDIYRVYGEYPYYKQFDRTIILNKDQCFDGLRGIQYS